MRKDTPSMAKNRIKRSLNAILDPHPTPDEVARIWTHFQSSCAYCGLTIHQGSRDGHLDHAVSTALGGTNSVHSHVLACGRCNGDEKREESWESFLPKKCPTQEVLAARRTRICEWLALGVVETQPADAERRRRAMEIIDQALASFDTSVAEMRRLRRNA